MGLKTRRRMKASFINTPEYCNPITNGRQRWMGGVIRSVYNPQVFFLLDDGHPPPMGTGLREEAFTAPRPICGCLAQIYGSFS